MVEQDADVTSSGHTTVIKSQTPKLLDTYEQDHRFRPALRDQDIHTTAELVGLLERDSSVDIEARVLAYNDSGRGYKTLTKKQFLETFKNSPLKSKARLREALDSFATDTQVSGNLVGQDFIPMVGGPFHKQQYSYDYIKGHSEAFFAFHHDPLARFCVQTIRDFTLGRGFRVDAKHADPTRAEKANAIWAAADQVNDFNELALEWIETAKG